MTSSKLDHANYNQFVSNVDMAHKTIQRVSVPNLKVFEPMKTELWSKEAGEFSVMLYGKMGFVHQPCCHSISVWRFSRLLTAITLSFIGIST